MANVVGPPSNVIRNRAITSELRELLTGAADAVGIDKVVIVSGGQTSNHAPHLKGVVGGWTGSRRHDNGRAADIEIFKNGSKLSFTDSNGSQIAGFVTAVAARGATGIGAGVHYMGRNRIHVGFGKTTSDLKELVWGAGGASANAPNWLKVAAREGWDNPVNVSVARSVAASPQRSSGRSVVAARDGLWLRRGAGLHFDRSKLLAEGTEIFVLGLDGDWARVDLEGDGRADGHVYASYLKAADELNGDDEGVEEIADDMIVAELLDSDESEGATPGDEQRRARSNRRSGKI